VGEPQGQVGQIGYVGLGSMGGALAQRLQLSHHLLVHDLNAAAVANLVGAGATACSSAQDLAERCDVIMLCLPTSDHVRTALFGPDGIASSARAGTVIVDQTTGDPMATRDIAQELARHGLQFADAPVSGGIQGAAAGTIAIMVGAEPDVRERVLSVLRSISPNVFVAGGVGNGHLIKLVNNLLSCAQRLLTLEGMALAVKNGMDASVAAEILGFGGGRNAYIERILGPKVLKGDLHAGFTLGLAHKDVRLACAAADQSGVPFFFGALTRELYQAYAAELGRDAQVDTAALVIQRLAGTQIVPSSDAV
jgi:3-hydroxyisobutyrate dehydrogenase